MRRIWRERMIQSGDLKPGVLMTRELFLSMANAAVDHLDVAMARKEVELFVKNPGLGRLVAGVFS